MWSVKTIYTSMPATITLDKSKFGEGLPKPFSEKLAMGFSYFQLIEVEKGSIKKKIEEFITSQIAESSVLVAVTPKQYAIWKKWEIIAKPAVFCWN